MNKSEQMLFLELCNFMNPNKEKIEKLLTDNATPCVLGHIFFNRMQSVVYGTLKKIGLINLVNREFRNSLDSANRANIHKNKSFYKCVQMVSEILKDCKGRYAMLKGALLCGIYPEGYRTSNDIDLLVIPEYVSCIGDKLTKYGFKQGYIKNNIFVPATRREIIYSKMTRGETVPYILEVDLPYMKFLEVDINFSLDYKNNDDSVINILLSRVVGARINDADIISLCEADFFIHLCSHLYKEATTFPWIKMNRDMTLYKFCDIYFMLNKMTYDEIENMFILANELHMDAICGCVILWTADLFKINDERIIELARKKIKCDEDILNRVVVPSEKKVLFYEEANTIERFFADDRISLLKEEI